MPGDHPALPLTPEQLAASAHSVADLGAFAVHFHPRDADGLETLTADHCGAAVAAVRDRCPGLPIGLSTSADIEPDPERRLQLLAEWTVLPDFVSVNLREAGAAELVRALPGMGIGVEAGIWTARDAELLATEQLSQHCVRVLVEPHQRRPNDALRTVAAIDTVLDEARIVLPRVYHGRDETTWTVIEVALAKGRDVRVGLEDTLVFPDERLALDNAQLVATVLDLAGRVAPREEG